MIGCTHMFKYLIQGSCVSKHMAFSAHSKWMIK